MSPTPHMGQNAIPRRPRIMITSRELAAIIWLVILVIGAMTRREARVSLRHLLRAFLQGKVLAVLVLYAAYVALWVCVAAKIGVWTKSLLADTIIWFVVSGFPLFLRSDQAGKDSKFFRREAESIITLSAIAGVYVNSVSFNLYMELILQPVIVALSVIRLSTSLRTTCTSMKRCCDILLIIVGFTLIFFTTLDIYRDWHESILRQLSRSIALTMWLPLLALPFIYAFSLVAGYELAFLRMDLNNDRRRSLTKAQLALIVGLKGRVRDVNAFSGIWSRQAASAPTFREALDAVRAFRLYRDEQRLEERDRHDQLRRLAGISGTDAAGRQLDQREFAETKEALRWLATCQMGWYRSRGEGYRPDLLEVLADFSSYGLAKEHGIVLSVRGDGQAWYAWRQTISGWVFAIGSATEPPDQWLYDGPDPPAGYPAADGDWDHFAPVAGAVNW